MEEIKNKIGQKLVTNLEFTVKDVDEENFVIEAIVATGDLDRHGEILDIEGLDINEYMANPVVAWAHDYSKPPIAKTIELKKLGQTLLAKMQFAVKESEFAREIYNLYKGKFLRAFSIGFIPLEADGNRFTKSNMVEYSAVLIPANANALALAKSKGINIDLLTSISDKKEKDEKLKGGEYEMSEIKEKKVEKKVEKTETQDNDTLVKAIGEMVDSKLENLKKELDAPEKKDITDNSDKKSINVKTTEKEIKPEEKLKAWVTGMATKDFTEYKQILKKDAMNTGDSEQSPLLPPTEFVAEVLRLEEQYGVAQRFATVRRTNRTSITYIKGGTDVEVFFTDEAGVKQSTKAGYDPFVLNFRKAAAIAPVTDELLEDSAIDIWNDLTQRFARAYARIEDQLVFTQSDGAGNINPGITEEAGVARIAVTGDSITDVTFDDINRMVYAVPTSSANNGRFFLHRTILGVIQRLKDDQGRYIWQNGPNGIADGTIWGYPYTLTEVLPSLSQDDDDEEFIVFGDLKNALLGERTSMQAKIFDSGSVLDPDNEEAELNLLTQDMQALRVVKRMNGKVLFPEAFSVLTTGAGIS